MDMLTLLIASVMAAPVEFPGGSPNDLAKALHESTGQPVVLAKYDGTRIDAFTFDPADPNAMAQAFRKSAGLTQAAGLQLALHPAMLNRQFIQIQPIFKQHQVWYQAPKAQELSVDAGKVTAATAETRYATMADLGKLEFSKPLRWSQWYEVYPMAIRAKEVSEAEFLGYVAKVIGAKLVSTKDSYTFAFEPNEFRNRAKRTFSEFGSAQDLGSATVFDKAAVDFALTALNLATNANLIEAFDTKQETRIPLNQAQKQYVYGVMAKLAEADANDLNQGRGRGGRGGGAPPEAFASAEQVSIIAGEELNPQREQFGNAGRRGRPPYSRILPMVDWNQQVNLVLMRNFRTQIEASTLPINGRPGQRIRI
jgi:hypothetical protein